MNTNRLLNNKNLSNKGFAITSMIYLILVMAVILMSLSLAVLSNRKLILDKQKDKALNNIYEYDNNSIKPLPSIVVDLPDGLVPVVYSNNSWKVADKSKKWYDYAQQEWANAVILNAGVTKNVGDTVNVSSEIKGMFVYVPRYEYKIEGQYGTHTDGTIGTKELPGEIKVNFISKGKTTPRSGYILHPAFNFGGIELNGIWVGKFETTGTASTPTILPSVPSLRGQTVSSQFTTARKFNTYINNSSIDIHMAKNVDWGAAAYLSQSKYGKYGNTNYTGIAKQVMINNCHDSSSNIITGIGADSQNALFSTTTCTTNTYETVKGQAASTTGNITGIYDMSGGSWEYVMGVLNKTIGSSEISVWPDTKYYYNYATTSSKTACNLGICYGQALSETDSWYNDYNDFLESGFPWLLRGGSYNDTSGAGVFYSDGNAGNAYIDFSFRIVITVN